LTIKYDPAVFAMGLDLLDYGNFSHTTTVSIFDPAGVLIATFDLAIDGPTGVFFGYEADAIGSVQLTGHPSGDFTWSTLIDNHTYEAAGVAVADYITDRGTIYAILGAGAVTEDFETYLIDPGDLKKLYVPILDSTTIVNGQGPGLVKQGATYVSGSGVTGDKFIVMGDGREGLVTQTLAAFINHQVPTTMTIEYHPPVLAMGLDLLDFGGFSHTTTVSVFDPTGALIESFDIFINGPTGVFFGYEADAIGSVRLTGQASGTSDSELLTIDRDGGAVTVVSPVHVDADIEAMCYFGEQVVGAKGQAGGGADLVTMDFQTGAITFLAHIDFGGLVTEIAGMGTDGDGVHWGYFENVGFATIEVAGAVGSFNVEIGCDAVVNLGIECSLVEGLAVSYDGGTLYAMVRDGRIVGIDVATGNGQVLADFRGLFTDLDIENLELTSNHELAFITEDAGHLYFSTLDVNNGQVISTEAFSVTGLEDIEAIIIPADFARAIPVGACPENLDGNEIVGVTDALTLLAAWGARSGPADLDGDGIVDLDDLLSLLAAWGPCPFSPDHTANDQDSFNPPPKREGVYTGAP
jgi:hypothetical protein